MKVEAILPTILLSAFLYSCNISKSKTEIPVDLDINSILSLNIEASESSIQLDVADKMFIFDNEYNMQKAGMLIYFLNKVDVIEKPIDVSFYNKDYLFYKQTFGIVFIDSLTTFYDQNTQFYQILNYYINNYNEEEQYNVKDAMYSYNELFPEEFPSTDFAYYLYNSYRGESKSCIQIKLFLIMLREIKLQNFWIDTEERNDPSLVINKTNNLLYKLKCDTLSSTDSLNFYLEKLTI